MKMSDRHMEKGFSIVEMLVVILLIGMVLGTIAYFTGGAREKGKEAQAKLELRALKNGIEQYEGDIGDYPEQLEDLVTRPSDEKLAGKWSSVGYLGGKKSIPKDPWKNKYIYQLTPDAEEHPFELYSYGPRGKKAKRNEYLDAWSL